MSSVDSRRGPLPQLFDQLWWLIRQFRAATAMLLWVIRAYMGYLWVRWSLGRWASLIALLFVAFVVAEIVLHYLGADLFVGGSLAVRIVFAIVMLLTSISHIRGWREFTQQIFFIKAAEQIAYVFSRFNPAFGDPGELLNRLLAIFLGNFARKGARSVNVFLFDADADVLRFHRCYPSYVDIDRGVTFRSGEGGAGTAFHEEAVVYIPWRRFEAAVVVRIPTATAQEGQLSVDHVSSFSILPRCYVPDSSQAFESVLSVPVIYSDRCYGVLNLDSDRPNAFGIVDFSQALFYGTVVGLYLHELERSGRPVR